MNNHLFTGGESNYRSLTEHQGIGPIMIHSICRIYLYQQMVFAIGYVVISDFFKKTAKITNSIGYIISYVFGVKGDVMVYVIAQFILLVVIAWPVASLNISIVGLLLILFSGFIALSALITNRPGNFNVRPHPKETGRLIVHGPYKYIRHPMYSSLFFGCLGILFCQFNYWKLGAWLLLIAVLALKARFEEKALCEHHPAYHEYQKSNKAFIPWVW